MTEKAMRDELTAWQEVRWWFLSRVWRAIVRRCAVCDSPLCEKGDPREGETHFVRSQRMGLGWVCDGCTSYPEG